MNGKIGQVRKMVPMSAAKKIVGKMKGKGDRVRRAKGLEVEGKQ
jgi:hypothetical protein